MDPLDPSTIPVGRTWRDLPDEPPGSLRAVDRAPAVSEPPLPPARRRVGRFFVAGAVIVALGFVVGVLIPPPNLAADAPDTDSPAASTLPDLIVPTLPPESTLPDSGTVLPPSLSPSNPLFAVTDVPDGFELIGNSVQVSPGRVDQVAVLAGAPGSIVIEAFTPSDAESMPGGDDIEVRGVTGVVSEGDSEVVLSWIDEGDVQFSITAPAEVDVDVVVALAESLEVS